MPESPFAILYRSWLWLGLPVVIGSVFLLAFFIRGVVAVVRKAFLFSVPLVEAQEVEFREAGTVILNIEGPRHSRRFAHVRFELTGPAGESVLSWPTLFHATTSGISKARMEVRGFRIARPGRYRLRLTSLGPPREKDKEHALVFMRPHLGAALVRVLGIVLASALMIVSLVFFLLRATGR